MMLILCNFHSCILRLQTLFSFLSSVLAIYTEKFSQKATEKAHDAEKWLAKKQLSGH